MGHGKKKSQKKVAQRKALSDSNRDAQPSGCEHLSDGFHSKKLPNIGKIRCFCETCSPIQAVENEKVEHEDAENVIENNDDIWLCLLCGREGCSRVKEGHALGHYERQNQHCIALSLKNFSCWCYKCDAEIYITNGLISDYILALKRRFDSSSAVSLTNCEDSSATETSASEAPVESSSRRNKKNSHQQCNGHNSQALKKSPTSVKGLANIGNTCFFNSTLQCLFHSTSIEVDLDSLLQATTYSIPCSKENGLSPTIPLKTGEKCHMSMALRDLFCEMKTSSSPLIYPTKLFNQICAKVPSFRGYQQQDAHELLRHLLDTVKNEETQRVKLSLSEKLSINGSKSADEIAMLKRVGDLIGNSTLVDKVFGGQMVDTIVCMECHSINTVLQHYLDISLPLKRPSFEADNNPEAADAANKTRRNKLRKDKKLRKPKEDKDGDWGDNDDNDEEVRLALARSMEGDMLTTTSGRPDSGLGSGSSGGDPADSSAFDGLPLMTPTESEELTDEHLLASIAALQVSNRESFPSSQKMSNKELRKRLQTLGNRPPPSEDDRSLYSALYWYTEREDLKRENRYACEQCQTRMGNKTYLTEGSKQTLIAKPPKILTLHLKRFEQIESRRGTTLQKISEHIDFPAELDMAPFLSREAMMRHWAEAKALAAEDSLPNSVSYRLRGVVEHSGSLKGGHYVAYVRPRGSDLSGNWVYISDGSVQNVSLDTVLKSNAYMLFYELDLRV